MDSKPYSSTGKWSKYIEIAIYRTLHEYHASNFLTMKIQLITIKGLNKFAEKSTVRISVSSTIVYTKLAKIS